MHKNIFLIFLILLIGYLMLVYCDEHVNNTYSKQNEGEENESGKITSLIDEGRTRRRHGLYHHIWGWHALAIAYWIKVKVIIVSFFLGSAIFLGLRYFWPNKCTSDIVHEGPIIYDHPHSFDHIPYSSHHSPEHFDHSSFSSSSFDPYSAYSDSYSDIEATHVTDIVEPTAPSTTHALKKRELKVTPKNQRQTFSTEEQIAEFMFQFLGLDSKACRRRFICEMEFRSNENPLTSMAFRIIGHGFFDQYRNERNQNGKASSFAECALVNSECVFIEGNAEVEAQSEIDDPIGTDINGNSNSITDEDNMEAENAINLKEENRMSQSNRPRGDRKLNLLVDHILNQKN